MICVVYQLKVFTAYLFSSLQPPFFPKCSKVAKQHINTTRLWLMKWMGWMGKRSQNGMNNVNAVNAVNEINIKDAAELAD